MTILCRHSNASFKTAGKLRENISSNVMMSVLLALRLIFRIGGSDTGGAEATEGLCSRAEEAVQGDERAG